MSSSKPGGDNKGRSSFVQKKMEGLGGNSGGGASVASRQTRTQLRVPYIQESIPVSIHHPGGSITEGMVTTQDLGADGVRFRYGSYLHAGTIVVITLRRRKIRSGSEEVTGVVTSCRYLSGSVHEIELSFKQPIYPQLFAEPAQWEQLCDTPAVEASALSGTILLLDDQEMDRDLFQHLIKGTSLTLTAVGTAEEAVEAVKRETFQVVCIDVNLGIDKIDGEQAGKMLREAGYKGEFVVTSVEAARRINAAKELRTTLSLQKPYHRAQLYYVLAMAFRVSALGKIDPIYSEMEERGECREMLLNYINQVQRVSAEIQRYAEANDFNGVRLQCQALRGTAVGYGFQPLADAAARAVTALDAGSDISEAEGELQVLHTICRRLSVEDPATPVAAGT